MTEIRSSQKSNHIFTTQNTLNLTRRTKAWLKLHETDSNKINQPISIEIGTEDTIDDLKTKFLSKMNSSRWANLRDNTCISIGYFCECNKEISLMFSQKEKGTGSHTNSPSHLFSTEELDSNIYVKQLHPDDQVHSYHFSDLSSQTNYMHNIEFHNYKEHLHYYNQIINYQLENKEPSFRNQFQFPFIKFFQKKKMINSMFNSKNLAPSGFIHRVLIEPDKLIVDILYDLFDSAQKSSNPLIVFFDPDESDIPSLPKQKNIEDISEIPHNHTSILNSINIDNENFLNSTEEFLCESKEKNSGSEQEDFSKELPNQGILLLPKNFNGDLSFYTLTNNSETSLSNTKNVTLHTFANQGISNHVKLQTDKQNNLLLPPPTPQEFNLQHNPLNAETKTRDKVFPRINVLIVEDNVINQAILSSFLRKNKINYQVAKNGLEAVDKWKRGGIHLILMDLQLPLLSGLDATKKIRKLEKINQIGPMLKKKHNSSNNSSHLGTVGENNTNESSDTFKNRSPVIIVALTASNSPTDRNETLMAGCNDYLTKPVNLDWLGNKITEWGCMQALIDFDGWTKGQRRMTDNVVLRPQLSSRISQSSSTSLVTKPNRSKTNNSNVEIDTLKYDSNVV